MKYKIDKISEKAIEFNTGWDNVPAQEKKILRKLCKGELPKISDEDLLAELDMVGYIEILV